MLSFPVHSYYNNLPKNLRVLWHQELDEVLQYPEVPKETHNFDFYPIFTPKIHRQTTLSSNVITRHIRDISDCVVTELWTGNDLSMLSGFFYELYKFFVTPMTGSNKLIWYPKDKTWRAFQVEPIALYCGEQEDQIVNPIHDIRAKDYRWLKNDVTLKFQILKPYDVPEMITYIEGT